MTNGWNESTRHTDHAQLARYARSLSAAARAYVISDAAAAMAANPDNPKSGYYADLIHACHAARLKGGR